MAVGIFSQSVVVRPLHDPLQYLVEVDVTGGRYMHLHIISQSVSILCLVLRSGGSNT